MDKKHAGISQPTQNLDNHRSRIIFAAEGVMSYKWKKKLPVRAVGGGTDTAGRIQQEEGQD